MSIEEEQSKQGTQCWKVAIGAYNQQQGSALIEASNVWQERLSSWRQVK